MQTRRYKIPDDLLLDDIKEHPDDYQYERARSLNCSKTGIYYVLKRLGISQKEDLRAPRTVSIKNNSLTHQGHPIVYIDESGLKHKTICSHGYSPISKPCIDRYNWQGKKQTNVISALY